MFDRCLTKTVTWYIDVPDFTLKLECDNMMNLVYIVLLRYCSAPVTPTLVTLVVERLPWSCKTPATWDLLLDRNQQLNLAKYRF